MFMASGQAVRDIGICCVRVCLVDVTEKITQYTTRQLLVDDRNAGD